MICHQSYHDLAVRLEPIILELEREQNDLLIIAHESVLRVLYSYLMHCSTADIPSLKFPRDEIIEIIPAAYQNEAKRIHIPGLDPKTVPGSPEDIRTPVAAPPAGHGELAPIPGMSGGSALEGQPQFPQPQVEQLQQQLQQQAVLEPQQRPPERVVNTAADNLRERLKSQYFISHLIIVELLQRGEPLESFRHTVRAQLASPSADVFQFGLANASIWFPDMLEASTDHSSPEN